MLLKRHLSELNFRAFKRVSSSQARVSMKVKRFIFVFFMSEMKVHLMLTAVLLIELELMEVHLMLIPFSID